MTKLACILCFPLLAACSSDLSKRLMPTMPISHTEPRWGTVQPGDSLVILTDRSTKGRQIVEGKPEHNALLFPAGTSFIIERAGTSRTSDSPAFSVSVRPDSPQSFVAYELLLPMVDRKAIFSAAALESEKVKLLPAQREKPWWMR